MPIIPTLRRLRQEDREFEARLIYMVKPSILKKRKKERKKESKG
jgi:hypothetical protein